MDQDSSSKFCTKCGRDKPAGAFNPGKRPGILRSWCKDCEADYQRGHRERKRATAPPPVMTRLCPCGSGLTVERKMQRNRAGRMSPGRWPLCSECRFDQAEYNENYKKTHRAQILAARRKYREDNREALLEAGRKRARQARLDDPAKIKARYREWYRQLRAKILDHYGTVCACCGGTSYLGIDHLNGDGRDHREQIFGNHRFGGGPNFWLWLVENDFPDGYQVLCRSCNRSKGTGPACTLNHERPAD